MFICLFFSFLSFLSIISYVFYFVFIYFFGFESPNSGPILKPFSRHKVGPKPCSTGPAVASLHFLHARPTKPAWPGPQTAQQTGPSTNEPSPLIGFPACATQLVGASLPRGNSPGPCSSCRSCLCPHEFSARQAPMT